MSDEERKRRKREEERKKQLQKLRQLHKRRSLHDKHKERRKKDCMIGMPFIIAFQGDPTQLFYCNDFPKTWELIPRTNVFPKYMKPLERLKQYMRHHVVHIAKKVLIYKAGRRHWNSRFGLKNSFMVAWIIWAVGFNIALWNLIKAIINGNILSTFVFLVMMFAIILGAVFIQLHWKFYNE